MAAVDSLVGLIDLRKAEGLVLEADRVPTLLGGRGGGTLTMPPVDAAMMAVFLEDLLSEEERAAVSGGKIVERDYRSEANENFVIKARLESGRAKVTIRKGALRRSTVSESVSPTQTFVVPLETQAPSASPAEAPEMHLPKTAAPSSGLISPLLQQILGQALARNASDVFLSAGRAPLVKVLGHVAPLEAPVLTEDRLLQMFDDWLSAPRRASLASVVRKSTIAAYFGHRGAAAFAMVVCLLTVACKDEPQEQTNLDGATSDALMSDAEMPDGRSAGEVGSGGTDTLTDMVISGVAATGIALPLGSPVDASCVGGKTAAKTALGGAFTLQAEGLTFPCLLRAHYGTGEQRTTLYSVAIAAGTINITPLTHAIVTKAIVGDPEAAFAMPAQAMLSGLVAKLPSLQTKLRKLLADQGLGANVTGDFFTGPLRPASPTNAGDAHDQLLDAVIARFGQTEALVFAFSAALVDLGLSARVDWTQCAESPRKSSEGGYYAVGCSGRAVLL